MLERNAPIDFLGRDGFHWFVGQVTQDTAWRTRHNQYTDNGFRAKVRILGIHPAENEEQGGIDDKDLPWAHFLVSSQFGAGNNYGGTSFALQGGETVLGFFLDGEQGQQPVVLGCFHTNPNIETPILPWEEARKLKASGFQPIAYDEQIQQSKAIRPGTPSENKLDPRGGVATSSGEVLNQDQERKPTINQIQDNKTQSIEQADAGCTTPAGMGGEITKVLQGFINRVNELEQYKDGFIDPVLGTIVNMDKMIDKAARELDGAISGIIRKARTEMFKTINTGVENALTFLDPANLIKELEVKKKQDSIFCAIENFLKGLQNMIKNFLKELIGKLLNFPLCAAENFLGGLLGDIASKIQGLIAPFTSAVSKLAGITIPSFMDLIGNAMGLVQNALQLLKCEGMECDPEPVDRVTNVGPSAKSVMNFNSVLGAARSILNGGLGLQNVVEGMFPGISKVTGAIDSVMGINSSLKTIGNMESIVGGCNPFEKRCGPPRIELFGGGGFGAIANAVINETGKVVGVNMKSLGMGFTAPPYVSIFDDCNKGGGATGQAVLNDDGTVGNIIITNPGSGYLGPETATSDDDGVDVIGVIDGVKVVSTGGNYSPETTITTNSGCALTPVIENGRIVGASGQCDLGLVDTPTISVSDPTGNGTGAILIPITKFTKREDYEAQVGAIPSDVKLIRVIDCARIY
tara:strand:- start:2462 stop:4534 length:2073 start_codon:yes stop_codon:yes gene_type:complete